MSGMRGSWPRCPSCSRSRPEAPPQDRRGRAAAWSYSRSPSTAWWIPSACLPEPFHSGPQSVEERCRMYVREQFAQACLIRLRMTHVSWPRVGVIEFQVSADDLLKLSDQLDQRDS